MSKLLRKSSSSSDDLLLPTKRRKPVPHEFVLDAVASASPYTRPMFGCLAIYVRDKIALVLRDKPTYPEDNRSLAGDHARAPRESPRRVPQHALNQVAEEETHGMAGAAR